MGNLRLMRLERKGKCEKENEPEVCVRGWEEGVCVCACMCVCGECVYCVCVCVCVCGECVCGRHFRYCDYIAISEHVLNCM